jgi:hypothetical protein
MKSIGQGSLLRLVLRLFALPLLAVTALMVSVGSSQGQTQHVAGAKPSSANGQAPAPAAQNAVLKRAEEGMDTGIKVHGHWVIEVKNPGGKVTARREFENAIQPTGMSYLASLLAANNSPGALSIVLNGSGSQFYDLAIAADNVVQLLLAPGATSGPCSAWGPLPPIGQGNPGPKDASWFTVSAGPTGATSGPCLITEPTNAAGNSGVLGSACALAQQAALAQNQPPPCSTNLTITAPTYSIVSVAPSPQIVLTGTVTVPSSNTSGNITDVETIFETCSAGSTPSGCLGFSNVQTLNAQSGVAMEQANLFTQKTLDGVGTDPQPVPYNPGQLIAATVTISFQ